MPGQRETSGYPCKVACLLCDPAPVFMTLDQLAEHYIKVHPLLRPKRSAA